MKRKLLGLAILGVVLLGGTPVFANNAEIFDEITVGAEIKSQDLILKSDHVDIGARLGTVDLRNSETAKNSMYAIWTVTIKGYSLFNWSSKQ